MQAQGTRRGPNDCVGGTFATNRNFLCGGVFFEEYNLIVQFKSAVPIPRFISATAVVELQNSTATLLSPFWQFEAGGCNTQPLPGVEAFDQIPRSCVDVGVSSPWGTQPDGVEDMCYGANIRRPGSGVFFVTNRRRTPTVIEEGTNYYALHLRFNVRNRSTCTGCSDQVLVFLSNLTLESDDGSPPVKLDSPDKLTSCVTINGASPSLCAKMPMFPKLEPPCGPTPAEKPTWGRVKILYR